MNQSVTIDICFAAFRVNWTQRSSEFWGMVLLGKAGSKAGYKGNTNNFSIQFTEKSAFQTIFDSLKFRKSLWLSHDQDQSHVK